MQYIPNLKSKRLLDKIAAEKQNEANSKKLAKQEERKVYQEMQYILERKKRNIPLW